MVRKLQATIPQYRNRDATIVRRFGLRDIRPPRVHDTQATVQRSKTGIRRQAGLKAWATRVARYGPSGRRVHHWRRDPVVIIPLRTTSESDTPLAYDETAGGEAAENSEELEDEVAAPMFDEIETDAAYDTRDDTAEHSTDMRSPLAERALPVPASEGTAISAAQEMARLIDERRARLLGPQDLTQASRRPQQAGIGFEIFSDQGDPSTTDDNDEGEDKENIRPIWHGQQAPEAPGSPRALQSPTSPRDVSRPDDSESQHPRPFASFFE